MKSQSKKVTKIGIVGARTDGQAGVVLDVLSYYSNIEVVAFFDKELCGSKIKGIPILSDINEIGVSFHDRIDAIHVAIGDNKARYDIYKKILHLKNLELMTIIHPSSIISPSSTIGKGCFVGASATIQHNTTIGDYTIINTGVIVEHDNIIGEAVHIAPGSCTACRVKINDLAFLGLAVSVIADISIGSAAFIGSGKTNKKDVSDSMTMVEYAGTSHSDNVYFDLDER